MSDEDDYMSDKFLCGSVDDDIRPGLLKSHADQRNFQALKRKKELDEFNKKKNPNIKVLESEKRKEGLEKPLEQSNKGFALLQKMGYKPGDGIGKSENGRTEPVPIEVKSNREGLGRSQLKKEIQLKEFRKAKLNASTLSTSEYRSRIVEQNLQRQTGSDLRKSQKACENLDVENNICEPAERWYWLSTQLEDEKETESKSGLKRKRSKYSCDESDNSDENEYSSEEDFSADDEDFEENTSETLLSDDEKLRRITSYLRSKYFYCVWCSVKYNDEADMTQNCPGDTFQDH